MTNIPEPTENEIFAASAGFGTTPVAPGTFQGVDAFTPAFEPRFSGDQPVLPTAVACTDVQRGLSILLDGEVVPAQAQLMHTHMQSCLSCQSARTFQMQLRTVVAEKALDPMPDDVRARITKALGFS